MREWIPHQAAEHHAERAPRDGAGASASQAARAAARSAARTSAALPLGSGQTGTPLGLLAIKQALRSLECRTREALWAAMQSVLDLVVPTDALNCFAHCGYSLRVA